MDSFIQRKNIERYRRLLAETSDLSERQRIKELLAEEEAKLGRELIKDCSPLAGGTMRMR